MSSLRCRGRGAGCSCRDELRKDEVWSCVSSQHLRLRTVWSTEQVLPSRKGSRTEDMNLCATFEAGSMNSEVLDISSRTSAPNLRFDLHVECKDPQQEDREGRQMQLT
jgi:hypothetical protein